MQEIKNSSCPEKVTVVFLRNRKLFIKIRIGVKGLVEEFSEFVRPKLIKERMQDKQKSVENQKQVVSLATKMKKDIAI